MTTTPNASEEIIPTRHSLLTRLKNWDDQEGWREFVDTYWGLIYGVARKSGLTEADAEEVVQETVLSVAKGMRDFKTGSEHGSFKAWLLQTTRWRIADQFRKRKPDQTLASARSSEDTARTDTIERVADPHTDSIESLWEDEWETHVLNLALERLRHQVKAHHFQIFQMHVIRGRSVADTCRILGVSAALVYVVKHRLSRLLKTAVEQVANGGAGGIKPIANT